MKPRIAIPVAKVKAIPLSELARLAGSKRKVAKLAGLQNLGSINKESVLIDGVLYCPSKSTADWREVYKQLVEGEL